jgi:hypothetical protein
MQIGLIGLMATRITSQTSLEYLSTYIWAILILAVIISAFLLIGTFSSSNLSPRAQPNSCRVLRPYGPTTLNLLNLEGSCLDELPQYVFTSAGDGDYLIVNNSNSVTSNLNIQNNITISAWVYMKGPAPYHDILDKEGQYGMKLDFNNQPHACSPSNFVGWCLEWDTSNDWVGISYPIPNGDYNKWMYLAASISYNSVSGTSTKSWYANGNLLGTTVTSGQLTYVASLVTIGAISPNNPEGTGYGVAEWFNGDIADVQIYNTALSSNEVFALYSEGIGGVPVRLNSLVSWWPLNGNANDTSGDLDNGATANIVYVNSWTSSYSPP